VSAPAERAHAPDTEARAGAGLFEIVAAARRAVAFMTDLPVDQVVACAPEEAGWRVVLDVIEAPARLGDNDLLATYELGLDASGELRRIDRIARYHREEKRG